MQAEIEAPTRPRQNGAKAGDVPRTIRLSARDNVGLGVRPSLRLSRNDQARVAHALEAVDLRDLADRPSMCATGIGFRPRPRRGRRRRRG